MSYNIRHARGMDGEVNVERVAETISESKPDIVGLQEVDRGVARTNRRDIPAELAALTGMTAYFEKNIEFEGGDYGNAILTRVPIVRKKNELLPTSGSGERHGALQMVLNHGGREVLFLNTHIDHRPDDTDRLLAVARIREIVSGYGDLPAILCGDFNTRPETRTYEQMTEQFADAWELAGEGPGFTFRSDFRDRRIDYIWISPGGKITVKSISVRSSLASDHLPLVADLEILR